MSDTTVRLVTGKEGAGMTYRRGFSECGGSRRVAAVLSLVGMSLWVAVPGAGGAEAAGSTPFVAGSGVASARSLTVGPHAAGVNFSVRFGKAAASYEDAGARAQAQTLDLGIIGIFLSTNQCGGPPALPPSDVPRPLEASSNAGRQQRSAHAASVGGFVVAGGEAVDASSTPAASADTTTSALAVGSIAELDALSSHAESGVRGAGRDAAAVSQVGTLSLDGGLVQFRDLRWTVHQHTGAGATSTGDFIAGTATVRGAVIDASTPTGLASALDQANAALAPLGEQLLAPRVTVHRDGTVEVTPLVVAITGSAASPTLAAAIGAAQPVRNRLTDLIFGAGCYPRFLGGGAFTAVDVLTAAIDGTGEGDIEVGGVTAGIDATLYASPFGSSLPLAADVIHTTTVVPATTTRVPGTAPRASSAPPPAAQPAQAATHLTSSITRLCRTVHPSGQPACWLGAGTTAGATAVSVVVGLLVAELLRGRRRRASLEEAL